MKANKQHNISAKYYLITSNSPDVYYPHWISCDLSTATENDYKNICEQANKQFYTSIDNKHNDLNPEKNGAMSVCETGESGNLHIHTLVYSKNGIKYKALKNKFPHSHIEIARGTFAEIENYLNKIGIHKNKAETQNCEPVYWGILQFKDRLEGKKGFYSQINSLIANGAEPEDLYKMDSKFAQFSKAINLHYLSIHSKDIPEWQEITTHYLYGASGTGKTFTYKKLCDFGLADKIFKIQGFHSHKFDGYNPLKHQILFIDNLDINSIKNEELLVLLDPSCSVLDCRYHNTKKNWNTVYITSVQPPEKIYVPRNKHDSVEQFMRRLDYIVYHYIDDTYSENDSRRYKTIQVKANDYTSYHELENQAVD